VGRALVYYLRDDNENFEKELAEASKIYTHYIEIFFDIVEKAYANNKKLTWAKPLKKIYDLISAFLDYCSCKESEGDDVVFQYAPLYVLESVRTTRTLRLRPADYQNDPEEGIVFYKRLASFIQDDRHAVSRCDDVVDFLKELQKENPDNVVFIRSLTKDGNSLIMWNSSYGEGGNGVSIGIPKRKLNKGSGINKTWDEQDDDLAPHSELEKKEVEETNVKKPDKVPISKCGLYNIIYFSKNEKEGEEKQREELKKIADCLLEFSNEELKMPVMKKFLANMFTFAAHLVKDSSYKHEEESRLIYFDTVRKKNPYMKVQDGVYVETEPVLFRDDSDVVYFGPKVSEMTYLKFLHTFKYEGLPEDENSSVDKMLRRSGIKFR
jgi:hypothetical protein